MKCSRQVSGSEDSTATRGSAPENASTSEACSISYKCECMSSHAVKRNLESAQNSTAVSVTNKAGLQGRTHTQARAPHRSRQSLGSNLLATHAYLQLERRGMGLVRVLGVRGAPLQEHTGAPRVPSKTGRVPP